MASSWYPGHDTDHAWEISCDNPGYGELWIRTLGSDLPEWEAQLFGSQVGEFLEFLTALAMTGEEAVADGRLPRFLTPALARLLLPAFIKATLLAGSGSDRYERLLPDPEDAPAEPLCIHCNLGSPYSEVPTDSTWCARYGHTPFGQHDVGWDAAVRLQEKRREWWERMRPLRESAAVPS